MEEIRKFLRLLSKEELVSLCAAMMFKSLVDASTLIKDLSKLEGKK